MITKRVALESLVVFGVPSAVVVGGWVLISPESFWQRLWLSLLLLCVWVALGTMNGIGNARIEEIDVVNAAFCQVVAPPGTYEIVSFRGTFVLFPDGRWFSAEAIDDLAEAIFLREEVREVTYAELHAELLTREADECD